MTFAKKNEQIVVEIGDICVGNKLPFVLFGGLNVLESEDLAFHVCDHFLSVTKKLNIPYVFKASFDKANRTCISSYRGPGLNKGLQIFSNLKEKFKVKVLTDVHEINQVKPVSQVVDVIQLPAFLARQTDLIREIAKTKSVINIKKPQFISPWQILHIIEKFQKNGNSKLILCERGSNFGYDNLVVDMLGIGIMRKVTRGFPIILDVSHSLQIRDKFSYVSGGRREQIFDLARSGISVGIAGIFIESHPNPDISKCDGRSSLHLKKLEQLLNQIKPIDDLVKSFNDLYREY